MRRLRAAALAVILNCGGGDGRERRRSACRDSGHSKEIAGRIALKVSVATPCSQMREESCKNNDWPRGAGAPVVLLVTG
jgi:hypothetical protein